MRIHTENELVRQKLISDNVQINAPQKLKDQQLKIREKKEKLKNLFNENYV